MIEGTHSHFQTGFKNFLENFNRENNRPYHLLIAEQLQKKKYILPLELSDLKAFEDQLYDKFIKSPMEILRVMEDAVRSYVREKR